MFQNIVARWPGSAHDATIFNNSLVKIKFDRGDFRNGILLGKFTIILFIWWYNVLIYTLLIFYVEN